MNTLQLDLNKRYTYADYLTWLDEKRRELINGFIHLMTPAPARKHQEISVQLVTELNIFLRDKDLSLTPKSSIMLYVNNM